MLVDYPGEMTVRDALARYFEANGFGPNGGYDEPWVDFKLGPIPMPIPNTKARVAAVRHHDIHHILTGYDTDMAGELEISAWEIAAGCKGYVAAWALNLGGMAGGLFRLPARSLAAFVRGRAQRTTYADDLEEILALTVAEARARYAPEPSSVRPRMADRVLHALATAVGLVVAVILLLLVVPLVPFGLLSLALRRRAQERPA
jgi:hypothetical protein